jgi:Smg protein
MKENVLDVLMYLFEHYMDDEADSEPDRQDLQVRLQEAGFPSSEIDRALGWLDRLVSEQPVATRVGSEAAQRVYTLEEQHRLNIEARGFLVFLEQNGLLTTGTRELVIDRVMELDAEEIDLDQLKWVVLMVLFNQPDDNIAYSRLEEVVMAESVPALTDYLH